ncbi:MAG: bifunctional phosphopantothenoylcysteine decarboxylase/phosphopantothenate--cysteine ligase CoaBC [Pyrinomonadaceae bacterium]|nr:bifunctional phosphopantothenoylcysteine decarboxylase/phosphopantothenate--cysteine ligase CoaBC [Pyrinomonadaceae bacterium]
MNLPENVGENQNYRVGLGVCGGIAAYKAIEVLRGLQKAGCSVKVAMTKHAAEFIKPLTFRALTDEYVLVDDYDISNPDPIAHINFSQNIDLLVIVPATANILAKFANGIADDFLTATYLASTAPILIAPAMNSTMLAHAATQRNLRQLELDGVHFVESQYGEMACKTVGFGRLNEPSIIVEKAISLLKAQKRKDENPSTLDFGLGTWDLKGESILITTGATREELDPIRFISNHSSGKMGFAVAEAARKRGAKVTVIAGITSVTPPEKIKIIKAISAEEMHKTVLSEIEGASVFIAAAAVADYRPKTR